MRTLMTDRLALRPWDAGFEDGFCELTADPRVTRYLYDGSDWPRERAVAEHRALLAHWEKHAFGWRGIFDVAVPDGRLIGLVALQRASGYLEKIAGPALEIGWWLAHEHWGKGIATEAATAVRDEAFTDHGAARLVAQYMPANPASGNVMCKIGMRHHTDTVGLYDEDLRIFLLDRADWVPDRQGTA